MSFEIVKATEGHLEQIAEIESKNFSLPWDVSMLTACISQQHIFLVAVDGDEVLGYVSIQHVLDEGYFNNIAVREESRNRGVADALMKRLDACAISIGLAFITLEVRQSNENALSLYLKHGYKQAGFRKKYYQKPVEDAVIMTKYLK